MPSEWTDAQDEIDRLHRRAQALGESLRAAQSRTVTAISTDQAVEASAAGRRLVGISLTAAATGLTHEVLAAALLDAAQRALAESARVIGEAAQAVVDRSAVGG